MKVYYDYVHDLETETNVLFCRVYSEKSAMVEVFETVGVNMTELQAKVAWV